MPQNEAFYLVEQNEAYIFWGVRGKMKHIKTKKACASSLKKKIS